MTNQKRRRLTVSHHLCLSYGLKGRTQIVSITRPYFDRVGTTAWGWWSRFFIIVYRFTATVHTHTSKDQSYLLLGLTMTTLALVPIIEPSGHNAVLPMVASYRVLSCSIIIINSLQ